MFSVRKEEKRFPLQADAVVGCFSLLQGCYLLLVTKKRLHGSVCGEVIIYSRHSGVGSDGLAVMNVTS